MDYGLRVQKILGRMRQDGIDSLLVTQGTDIRYVSGFSGEAGVAVIIFLGMGEYFIIEGRVSRQGGQGEKGIEIVLIKTREKVY